ncbi:hypothetical protein KIPB_009556 [Kipferlia bialata]|uniref:Uncharacterized protein n=1 Tax=Kipferlia bialata TaxID=797122 RepID=A0A9K3GLM3_9EUKA|nr:hypothetical protein KIPB_009556 [Kipferlia bialata]|eukprot:g9556.t1
MYTQASQDLLVSQAVSESGVPQASSRASLGGRVALPTQPECIRYIMGVALLLDLGVDVGSGACKLFQLSQGVIQPLDNIGPIPSLQLHCLTCLAVTSKILLSKKRWVTPERILNRLGVHRPVPSMELELSLLTALDYKPLAGLRDILHTTHIACEMHSRQFSKEHQAEVARCALELMALHMVEAEDGGILPEAVDAQLEQRESRRPEALIASATHILSNEMTSRVGPPPARDLARHASYVVKRFRVQTRGSSIAKGAAKCIKRTWDMCDVD